ncbi:hypothetical protein LTR53_013619, partial [Teratosphaeriaceae sp. CCFEE 6253]
QPYFSPRQPFAYPQQQQQTGTPLSGIPEQAMHAQSFQPAMQYGQPQYYPQYPPQNQQQYYYSSPGPEGYAPQPMLPTYMPAPPQQQQQGYGMMAPPPQMGMPPQPPQHEHYIPQHFEPPHDQPQPPPQHQQASAVAPESGMMAHESNGMVFYVPRSDIPDSHAEGGQSQQNEYQPAESFVPTYAMPGLPPPTPAPEGLGPQGYYYPHGQMYFGQQ